MLQAISDDFVGPTATEHAMSAVVAHRVAAVQEILGMGGQLDAEEEEELRDTETICFEELDAFARGLQAAGVDAHAEDTELPPDLGVQDAPPRLPSIDETD